MDPVIIYMLVFITAFLFLVWLSYKKIIIDSAETEKRIK